MGTEAEGLRPRSVLIVDNQRYTRLGLALMIRKAPDLHVVAEAGDGQEALEVLEELNRSTGLPDVVLMDVRMPGMDGISATRAMTQRFPTVKVLVLTTYDEDDYVFGALEMGASGFLLKDLLAPQRQPHPRQAPPARPRPNRCRLVQELYILRMSESLASVSEKVSETDARTWTHLLTTSGGPN